MKREEKIHHLQEIVRIPSVNDNERTVAKYYQKLLQKHGIKAELVNYSPTRSNLIAEVKGKNPGKVLIFSGHMDVVAAGELTDWTYPPFDAVIEEGKMYGRGTTDMKAGLTALVLALIELKKSGKITHGTVRLVATVGEEIGMLGSKQITEEGYIDDADAIIVAEPKMSDGKVVTAHKGSVQYEIISHGRTAHSSMPEKGINSIQQLVDFIQITNKKFEEAASVAENKKLGRMLNAYTVIHGGDQINSIPALTTLRGNGRTIPEVDNTVFLEILHSTIEEMNQKIEGRLELNLLQNNPPVESDFHTDLIQSIKNVSKHSIEAIGMAGATDASNFGRVDKKFDLAIFGPGEMTVAHAVDEYVDVDDYLDFIDFYYEVALDYLQSK